MLQGRLHFLRGSDDLDCSSQIAPGAIRVAVAAGEGKTHGAWAFTARCSIGRQYGADALPIKRCAGEGGIDQLIAEVRGRLVGNREPLELFAMGGQFLRVIGKAENEGAGGWRVDARNGDGACAGVDRRVGGHETAVLEAAPPL